jgi:hypothetical protein
MPQLSLLPVLRRRARSFGYAGGVPTASCTEPTPPPASAEDSGLSAPGAAAAEEEAAAPASGQV